MIGSLLMKPTICFNALQTLPIKQQRSMVKRLQQENKQCDHIANENVMTIANESKPSDPREQVVSDDQK